MIIGPFLCSTTFTITNDLRCRGYSSSSSSARKREKDRTRLFYSSFSSIIDFRASAVSIARFSIFPAAVLPYHRIRVGSRAFFLISIAAVLPYPEYEQVSVHFLSFSLLCSAARPTELRIAVILSPESLTCLARVSNYGSRSID